MRPPRLLAFVLAASCVACAGNGFRLVPRTVKSTGFEGLAHYTDLYCGSTLIAKAVRYHSVSPSGRFAAFVEDGRLRLTDRRTKETTDATEGAYADPQCFGWDEAAGELRVEYFEREGHEHSPSVIRLPS